MKQRGFTGIEYIIAAGIFLGLLTALLVVWKGYINSVDRKGYNRGVAETMVKWEAADRVATENAATARRQMQAKVDELNAKHGEALELALSYHDDWEKGKNDARRAKKPLTVTTCPASGSSPDDRRPADADVRLTGLFVRTYDAAWTGPDGKPLYPDTGEPAQTAGQTGATGYTVDDLLDTHGKNAKRFNDCVRDYTALINTVLKLKADWGTAAPGTP